MYTSKTSQYYRNRIIAALKKKKFFHPENYSLSAAKPDSLDFLLTLKTPSLSTQAKRTQLATITKGFTAEFGTAPESTKKDAELIPNFSMEETDHFNVVKINLLAAYNAEHPDARILPGDKIPVLLPIPNGETKVKKKKKKKGLTKMPSAAFSSQEMFAPKEMPVGELTAKMLNKVASKGITLNHFLDTMCRVCAKGEFTLYKTKAEDALDYLQRVKGNRKLKESHVRKLMKAYKKDGFLFRIMYINEKLEIIDGQHGIEAARRLGLPIYFMIMPGWEKEVTALNINSESWTLEDFMELYAEEGNPNYVVFKKYYEVHSFDITTCQVIISNRRSGGRGNDAFREGKLIVTDNQLHKAYMIAKEAELFKEYHPRGCYKRNFVQALMLLQQDKRYDYDVLLGKYQKKHDSGFYNSKAHSLEEYLDILVRKYNNGLSDEEKIQRPVLE